MRKECRMKEGGRRWLSLVLYCLFGFIIYRLFRVLLLKEIKLFVVGLAGFWVALSLMTRSSWIKTLLTSFGFFGSSFIFGIWTQYEKKFGRVEVDTFQAIFQADFVESIQYIRDFLTPTPWIYSTIATLVFLGAKFLPFPAKDFKKPIALFLIAGFFICTVNSKPLIDRVKILKHSISEFREELDAHQRMLHAAEMQSLTPLKELSSFRGNIVFVIGESTTRKHMSLYGYHRPTTPHLDQLKNELIIQTDAISPHSHTAQSLTEILTNFNYGDSKPDHKLTNDTLVSLIKRSGLKTFWYSNQNELGLWDNPVTTIAKQSDEWRFFRKGFRLTYRGGFYDEALLPSLDQALNDPSPSKFIVLHFYATHHDYCLAFPSSFRSTLQASDGLGRSFFGDSDDLSTSVNCYDNAVRYVDSLLDKVIHTAQLTKEPTIVVYVSDHGENPLYGTGHNSATHSAYHIEVPLIWYFNSPAKAYLKDKIIALRKNASLPFKTSNLFHTILDLAGIDRSLMRFDNSVFSLKYEPRPRKTLQMGDGDREYVNYDQMDVHDRKGVLERTRINLNSIRKKNHKKYHQVWAHRVDSLGKLFQARDYFSGVELDLVFDSNKNEFFVYHPPKENMGLTLKNYLTLVKDRADLQFWFDVKNVSSQNIHQIVDYLEALDRKFKIKKRTIVETGTDAVFDELKVLGQLGYRHSYYLPTDQIVTCSERLNERLPNKNLNDSYCDSLASKLINTAAKVGASRVSFDSSGYRFISNHPEFKTKFKLLTWNLSLSVDDSDFVKKFSDSSPFEIVLVNFPSQFGY